MLPGAVSSAIGANMHHGPSPISSFGHVGLPAGAVSNGPSQVVNLGAVTAGSGINMAASHVGSVTGSHVVFGNPRLQVQTAYPMDMSKMRMSDVGDMEFCWEDTTRANTALDGPNRPSAYLSWSHLNWLLKQPDKDGNCPGHDQKTTAWFDERFRFIGVMRHEPRNQTTDTIVYQLFTTGNHTRVYDLFQAFQPNHICRPAERSAVSLGPTKDSSLWILLLSHQKLRNIDREMPIPGVPPRVVTYWQLSPWYSSLHAAPKQQLLRNHLTNATGKGYAVAKMKEAYNGAIDPAAARQVLWNPESDGGHKMHHPKIRQIDIELMFT